MFTLVDRERRGGIDAPQLKEALTRCGGYPLSLPALSSPSIPIPYFPLLPISSLTFYHPFPIMQTLFSVPNQLINPPTNPPLSQA